jgi:CHAD domain-containing protein
VRINSTMACDTTFRVVARRCLSDLTAHHEATCKGDPAALYRMRVALTRLRTAILFFSPMVADSQRTQIRQELKWLNGHLGAVRDLDVAIKRLKAAGKRRPQAVAHYRFWNGKRADAHRLLARVLRSARYRRLVKSTSDWIDNGPWCIKAGTQFAGKRASPIVIYSAGKLTRWREKLLKKYRKLPKMSTRKRHRLRLLNKKLCYSIEFFEGLFADKGFAKQQAALKYLRRAKRSLGQLNDDANSQSLAAALQREGIAAPSQILTRKREKRLIRTATTAYEKLAALKTVRA